jgi:Phage integrase family
VPLFGLALDAVRTWQAQLAWYAPKNPLGLLFPTERGKRRDKKPPRGWPKAIAIFGDVPRIARKPWWHLLRHTCASSLVSGAWGFRWSLEDVSKMLGHSSINTTEIYAHFAPSAVQNTATQSQEIWDARCHERCHASEDLPEKTEEDRGAPQRIRTSDLRLRRPSLYPAELVAQSRISALSYTTPTLT